MINYAIDSINGFDWIKELLKKMLRFNYQDRIDMNESFQLLMEDEEL